MIVSIVGPTATGKTALSLAVAELLGGPEAAEIISADAMQLYRGMDIGTAKLPEAERRGIVHHQIDVLDIHEEASVAAYQRSARADLEGILAAGKTPIVVGGSGLYVAGLLDELEFPGRSQEIRDALASELETKGIGALLAELKDKDPQAWATIEHRNERRILRALEVIRLTGKPFTARFPRHTSHYPDICGFVLERSREAMEESIDARTRQMFADGLVEETRVLLDAGLRETRTARAATGYAEAIAVLDGEMTPEDASEAVTRATLKLVRKQRTWFRADPRLERIDVTDGDLEAAARRIGASLGL